MEDTKPTDWPVLTVPGLGAFTVKLDMGVFYDIEAETGKDYFGVLQALYGRDQTTGAANKLSTVQLYDLVARGIVNADPSLKDKLTARQLAGAFPCGDNIAVSKVIVEALKKTQSPTQEAQPSLEQPATPVN